MLNGQFMWLQSREVVIVEIQFSGYNKLSKNLGFDIALIFLVLITALVDFIIYAK